MQKSAQRKSLTEFSHGLPQIFPTISLSEYYWTGKDPELPGIKLIYLDQVLNACRPVERTYTDDLMEFR
jgi:hypothetical protein